MHRESSQYSQKTDGSQREMGASMISFSISLSCFLLRRKKVEQLVCCGSDPVGRGKSVMQERGIGLSLEQGQCLVMEGEPSPEASLLVVGG